MEHTLSEIHGFLAAMLQAPELALDDGEAASLARAVSEVSRHYTIPHVGADKMALAVLVWTAGRIYVPKIVAIKTRKSLASSASVEASTGTVWTAGLDASGLPKGIIPEAPEAAWFTPRPDQAH